MGAETKIALITGASRGLGAAAAKELAQAGWHVIAIARTVGALEELDDAIQELGGSATLAPLDVTDKDAVANMCASIHQRWGGADLWLHTAVHAAPLSPVGHIDAKDFSKSLGLNVTAVQNLIACIDPLLRAKNGQAVYCRDDVAGQKFFGSYGASKAAEAALFQSWAAESEAALSVTDFAPNPMPTACRGRFYPGEDRDSLTPCEDEAKRLLSLIA